MRRTRSLPQLPYMAPRQEAPQPTHLGEASGGDPSGPVTVTRDPPKARATSTLYTRRGDRDKGSAGRPSERDRASNSQPRYTPKSLESIKQRNQQGSQAFSEKDPWLAQSLRLTNAELDLSRCKPTLLATVSPALMKSLCVVAAIEKRPITSLKLPATTKALPAFVKAMGDLQSIQIRTRDGKWREVPIPSARNTDAAAGSHSFEPIDSGTYINKASHSSSLRTVRLNGIVASDGANGSLACDELSKFWIHQRRQPRGTDSFSYAHLSSPDFLALNRYWITELANFAYSSHHVVADAILGGWLEARFSEMPSQGVVRHYSLQIAHHAMALELRLWTPSDASGKTHFRVSFYDPNGTAQHQNRWTTSAKLMRQWTLDVFRTPDGESLWKAYLPDEQSGDKVMLLSEVPAQPGAPSGSPIDAPVSLMMPTNTAYGASAIGLLYRANDLANWRVQLCRVREEQGLNAALDIMFARTNSVDAYLRYNRTTATTRAVVQLLHEWGLTPGAICHQLLLGLACVGRPCSTAHASEALMQSPLTPGRHSLHAWCEHVLLIKQICGRSPTPDELAILLMPHRLQASDRPEEAHQSPNDAWEAVKKSAHAADLRAEVWVLPEGIDMEQGLIYPPFYSALAQYDVKHMAYLTDALEMLLQQGLILPDHVPGLLTVQVQMPDGTAIDLREQLGDDENAAPGLEAFQHLCDRLSQTAQSISSI